MKNILLIYSLIISSLTFSQSNLEFIEACGFKKTCECSTDSTNKNRLFLNVNVLKIDTLLLSNIVKQNALDYILKTKESHVKCAKKVTSKKIIVAKVKVLKTNNKTQIKDTIFICTPLQENSCGYLDFQLNKNFKIHYTKNKFADIYFTWSAPLSDKKNEFFELKNQFLIWTNYCQGNEILK